MDTKTTTTAAALRAKSAAASDAFYITEQAWKRGVQGITAKDVMKAKREAMAAIRAWEAALQS